MKKSLCLLFSFLSIAVTIRSQGIEVYGGYPVRLHREMSKPYVSQFNNLNNGQGGIYMSIFSRPLLLQLEVGYISNNYSYRYNYPSGEFPVYKALSVSHYYVHIPLMVYPKLYADDNNVFSIGGGCNLLFPSRLRYRLHYDNGMVSKGTGYYL